MPENVLVVTTRLIDQSEPLRLGADPSPLAFIEEDKPPSSWRGNRYLTLDGQNAFQLSYWCGTCPFLFQKIVSQRTLSIEELQERLNAGLQTVDPGVLDFVSALVPQGEYLPMLLEVRPRLITPMREGDYFAEDQVRTWGLNANIGLPEYPRTAYYRTDTRDISPTARLFEFVVPMVPPTWNDSQRMDEQSELLAQSAAPTALAVSILDRCQPAVSEAPEASVAHLGLAHFLLDGHHKMEAAARTGRPLRLLSVLSIENGLAPREDVLSLPTIFAER